MSRAPFVQGKATSAFSRQAEIHDTTIGWRFINPLMKKLYGVDSMPETAENVADDYQVSRADQDEFAAASHQRAAAAAKNGLFAAELVPVPIAVKGGEQLAVTEDEGIRPGTTAEALAKLDAASQQIPMPYAHREMAGLYIVNPLAGMNVSMKGLFSDHPPTADRIARLLEDV